MNPAEQDFAETYRSLPEEEIAGLYAEIGTLTDGARAALILEIQRRGLGSAHLSKVHSAELRHEALFDRLQTQRRKKLAWYLLTRNNPKGLIAALLAFLVMVLISELIGHHH